VVNSSLRLPRICGGLCIRPCELGDYSVPFRPIGRGDLRNTSRLANNHKFPFLPVLIINSNPSRHSRTASYPIGKLRTPRISALDAERRTTHRCPLHILQLSEEYSIFKKMRYKEPSSKYILNCPYRFSFLGVTYRTLPLPLRPRLGILRYSTMSAVSHTSGPIADTVI
jgi:hypothetical protein